MSDLFAESQLVLGNIVQATKDHKSVCGRREVVAGTVGSFLKASPGYVFIYCHGDDPDDSNWFDEKHWEKKESFDRSVHLAKGDIVETIYTDKSLCGREEVPAWTVGEVLETRENLVLIRGQFACGCQILWFHKKHWVKK